VEGVGVEGVGGGGEGRRRGGKGVELCTHD
jgi:hypothetical protein